MGEDLFSGLTLVTPPASDPVSVADAKAHSRVFISAEDALLAGYLHSATVKLEGATRRAFMPQIWRYALAHFPGRSPQVGYRYLSSPDEYYQYNHIEIPKPPLVSIVSFTYLDTLGNSYNMQEGYDSAAGNYVLDLEPEPGRIVLPFAGIWPTTILLPGSPIRITYNCGFAAWSGTVDVNASGIATLTAGAGGAFDPRLAGTWVTVGGASFAVASVTDATHLQLVVPFPIAQPSANPLQLPATGLGWTGNAVWMPLRHAILELTAHMYENREPVATGRGETAIEIPLTIDHLIADYRV